ncbi:hypothetical protein QBC47DRAFT_458197 [Echria macrotheca]|uniref:Uncharacterized protein n=1 Tax=Echria macrotheca TaxID=438768 RepID=A0AAJ0FC46_9PEZI|nr:hypothetical protein QBC47DRAFT_458197 [Echria macrotheca]
MLPFNLPFVIDSSALHRNPLRHPSFVGLSSHLPAATHASPLVFGEARLLFDRVPRNSHPEAPPSIAGLSQDGDTIYVSAEAFNIASRASEPSDSEPSDNPEVSSDELVDVLLSSSYKPSDDESSSSGNSGISRTYTDLSYQSSDDESSNSGPFHTIFTNRLRYDLSEIPHPSGGHLRMQLATHPQVSTSTFGFPPESSNPFEASDDELLDDQLLDNDLSANDENVTNLIEENDRNLPNDSQEDMGQMQPLVEPVLDPLEPAVDTSSIRFRSAIHAMVANIKRYTREVRLEHHQQLPLEERPVSVLGKGGVLSGEVYAFFIFYFVWNAMPKNSPSV